MSAPTRLALLAGTVLLAATPLGGCNEVAAVLPALGQLGFCGADASAADLLKLGEGPAVFVDAIRTVSTEVAKQAQTLGKGLDGGFSVSQETLQALGPYSWSGAGTYRRDAAADRAFRLRFFYGAGVAGKTPDAPIEADLAKLSSYLPDPRALIDPGVPKGPLFPLIDATGLTSGTLGFRDEALRFDVGSVVTSTVKGYGLNLGLGTARTTVSGLLGQLSDRKLALSLEDTALTNAASGFKLAIKKFDLTVGLDGKADLGGNYLFQVNSGALTYFGAVDVTAGAPVLSLRCGEGAATEFATMSFVDGRADMKIRAENFPITLPGLAPLYDQVKGSL